MQIAVADPDLKIRGEPGHPDPEIRGNRPQKKIWGPFGPQFGLKLNGEPGGSAPLPWIRQ